MEAPLTELDTLEERPECLGQAGSESSITASTIPESHIYPGKRDAHLIQKTEEKISLNW